jgi:hypothetical protein
MSDITEFVDVSIEVQDISAAQEGFGVPLVLGSHALDDRVKTYTGSSADILASVLEDFPATDPIYKCVASVLRQNPTVQLLKVGQIAAGDADASASLTAVDAADADWYCLFLASSRSLASALLCAAWIELRRKIFVFSSEDSDIPDAAESADLASQLKALGYHRTAAMYHHQAGVTLALATETVVAVDEVATVTKTDHTLRVGDTLTNSGAVDEVGLNGNKIVASVPTANTFTFDATGLDDVTETGVMSCEARYTFPEAAWAGKKLPLDPGSTTWKFSTLSGIVATPKSIMSSSAKAAAIAKNANVYVEVASLGITQEGKMVSGRFIDLVRGIDWLTSQIESNVFTVMVQASQRGKVPYDASGLTLLEGAIREKLQLALDKNLLTYLTDDNGNQREDGQAFIISTLAAGAQEQADRVARIMRGFSFVAQAAGAVHKVVIRGSVTI